MPDPEKNLYLSWDSTLVPGQIEMRQLTDYLTRFLPLFWVCLSEFPSIYLKTYLSYLPRLSHLSPYLFWAEEYHFVKFYKKFLKF